MNTKNNDDYNIIKKSGLFDEYWFKEQYALGNDVDLIEYYLNNAISLNLNPSPYFNSMRYLKKYPDVKKAGLNPFVHYIVHGIHEGRSSEFIDFDIINSEYSLVNNYTSSFFKRYDDLLKDYANEKFTDNVNIGVFIKGGYESFFPTGYIRIIIPFYHIFAKKNINPYLFSTVDLDKIKKGSLFRENNFFDIIVVQRDSLDAECAEILINHCKKFNTKLIFEIDDDLLSIDENHPDYEEFSVKQEIMKYLISNADVITVSTKNLREKLLEFNSNIFVIRNGLNNLFSNNFINNGSDTIKIGYMGSNTHKNDFNIIKDAIVDVKRYFSNHNMEIIFEIIGVTDEIFDYVNQIEIPENNQTYPNFIKWLNRIIDWDIGLAPLEFNEINNSKSEIKYIEYSALGVPGIYSDVGAYSEVIENFNNGILIKENTTNEWKNAIINLIENKSLREDIIKNSHNDVFKNYSLDIFIHSWEVLLESLLPMAKKEIFNKPNKYPLFSNPIFKRNYKIISDSGLFDEKYYIDSYSDIMSDTLDPIYHYLSFGVFEGCNPLRNVNLEKYIKDNNININETNPLIHYISNNEIKFNFRDFDSNSIEDICENIKKKVSIIIPIYNAYCDTKKCIESVLKYSTRNFELVLINDCSTDLRIDKLLNYYKDYPNVRIINNIENKGFTGTVNVGLKNSSNDVILLNSDTIVTPKWLEKLTVAAYSNPKIGTVTPFSNNAGAFSVPIIGKRNIIWDNFPLNIMANLVEKVSDYQYLRVPTGNGFCLYIKRDTIKSVGCFDEDTFGRGYGEENDYCMRAIENNWENIIDDSTYIYHNQGSSFSSERDKLMIEHRDLLNKKHPSYTREVRKFLNSEIFKNMHDKISDGLIRIDSKKFNKKRILFVIHSRSGGSPKNNDDLMRLIEKDYDCYLLFAHTQVMVLYHFKDNKLFKIKNWELKSRWWCEKLYDNEYRNIYFNVLVNLKIDLVHIHHFMHHTFDLPIIANVLNIPIIFSSHDFYMICPSFTLLNENYEYCGGKCNCNLVNCQLPSSGITQKPIMKSFVDEWRANIVNILEYIDYFIVFSDFSKDLFLDIYPNSFNKNNLLIVEHGKNYPKITKDLFEIPSSDKPIKILCIGNILEHKGSKIIENIHKLDIDSNIEFHFLGTIDENLKDIGIYHGTYELDNLKYLIEIIKPSFIGIFSICPETFCFTLSEAWAHNMPVLSTKIGVIEKRMLDNNGGLFIDMGDMEKSYGIIMDIKNNPNKYINIQKNIEKIVLKSEEDMYDDYIRIYNKLCNFDKEVKL